MTLIELKKTIKAKKAQRTRLISKRNVLFSKSATLCWLSPAEKALRKSENDVLTAEIRRVSKEIKDLSEVIFDLERQAYEKEEMKAWLEAVIAEAFSRSEKAEEEGNKVEAEYWYNLAAQSKSDMESEGMA